MARHVTPLHYRTYMHTYIYTFLRWHTVSLFPKAPAQQVTREIIWTLNFTMKGYIYPDVKSGSVVKTVLVHLRTPGSNEIEDPEYIILEDSTTFSTNYLLLNADALSPNATGTMKVLNELSSTETGAAGIKSRITTTPKPTDVTANDDFGYTQTFEYFNDTIDNDPTTGLDVTL